MSIWMIFPDKSFSKGKINMNSLFSLIIFFHYIFSEKKGKLALFFQKYNTVQYKMESVLEKKVLKKRVFTC